MSTPAMAAPSPARIGGLSAYVELARPFTLLPPALGVLSGAVTAWGAGHSKPEITAELLDECPDPLHGAPMPLDLSGPAAFLRIGDELILPF